MIEADAKSRKAAYHKAWCARNQDKTRAYSAKYAKSETRAEYLAQYKEANRDRLREKKRAWAKAREEHVKATNAAWHTQNKARRASARLERTYGITLADYDLMLAQQGGGCAVCGVAPGEVRHPVDHCHATGRIRGILCTRCNITLGRFGDDAVILRKLAAYLGGSQ